MDVLNFNSTEMYTILALIPNFTWNLCKKWTSSLKLIVIFTRCHNIKIAQRIFNCGDMQHISLTPDEELNSLIYETFFYVNICGSYKLLKTVRYFGPPCSCQFSYLVLEQLQWRTITCSACPKHGKSLRWHYICVITDCISAKTKNTFISAVISEHYSVACLW